MICPVCGAPLEWDVQRASHELRPTVFLYTKCWACNPKDEPERQVLEVIWPVAGKPPTDWLPIGGNRNS